MNIGAADEFADFNAHFGWTGEGDGVFCEIDGGEVDHLRQVSDIAQVRKFELFEQIEIEAG